MHIINMIFSDFEKENIKYCHFKSNQHLNASFEGESDFDILLDTHRHFEIENILLKHKCKRFEPEYIGSYPSVMNWIAFDSETGKLFHLHLHYSIVSGKSLVKDYALPWNKLFLDSAIIGEQKIRILCPEAEILLLVSRLIIKSKLYTDIKSCIVGLKFSPDIKAEYTYLKNRIDPNVLNSYALLMFSENIAKKIVSVILRSDHFFRSDWFMIRKTIRYELKLYRRMSGFTAFLKSLFLRISDLRRKFCSRKCQIDCITKKVTVTGGKMIAFIGVDGCGKSTISYEIYKWMKNKIEVKNFYMGEGDGKTTLFVSFIKKIKTILKVKNTNSSTHATETQKISKLSLIKHPKKFIKKFIHSLLIFSIVKNNHKKIIRMNKYRINGGFCIMDRYPQLQSEGMNDGLKLSHLSNQIKSAIIDHLSIKERKLIGIVNKIYPDIIFRFRISPETSMKRKPEEQVDYQSIKDKIKDCEALKFNGSKLIEIDAEKSLEEVILSVKTYIWSEI